MSLTLTQLSTNVTGTEDYSGTYTFIHFGPDYEFESGPNNTVTVRKANYVDYNLDTMSALEFGDAILFSCEFTMPDGVKETYMPDGGLKFWKVQRKVYRLIRNAERILETTMYYDGEIECSSTKDTLLPYTLVLDNHKYVHFEWLTANGKMIEIMNQCRANGITCAMRMRLKSGRCVSVLSN
jgi:hypothetical protein